MIFLINTGKKSKANNNNAIAKGIKYLTLINPDHLAVKKLNIKIRNDEMTAGNIL